MLNRETEMKIRTTGQKSVTQKGEIIRGKSEEYGSCGKTDARGRVWLLEDPQ
jgi:hypothetical protein